MSEQVAVIIPVPMEMAQAFQKIFPNAQIRRIKCKEEPKQETQQEPVKASTMADREKLMHDIVAYCKERNSNVDGVRFFNYYDARNWIDATGKKITDWKSKVEEWEHNGLNQNSKPKQYKTAYEAKVFSDPTFDGKLDKMVEDLDKI